MLLAAGSGERDEHRGDELGVGELADVRQRASGAAALADASRDDGTGCWPSAATIARKANISDRTVRRVIARLEAEGQVVVHRGGGRAGSTNSYTVVTGDRVIHSPGQNVTPDKLSGGDTGDRPPRTQPCQGTPDIAVSPDPPENHKGTAATSAREVLAAGPRVGSGGAEVGEFFEQLAARNQRWLLTAGQRKRLAPLVTAVLATRLDPRWPGQLRRSQQRWDQERGRRARGPARPSQTAATARQPTASVVRRMRRAHPDAGLRQRPTKPVPALQGPLRSSCHVRRRTRHR